MINSVYGVIKIMDLNHKLDYFEIKPNKNIKNTSYKLNNYLFFIDGD